MNIQLRLTLDKYFHAVWRGCIFLLWIALCCALPLLSFGQSTQSGISTPATVSIIVPVSVEKSDDLQFGQFSVSGVSGGALEQSPGGNRLSRGSVVLLEGRGKNTPAIFEVIGEPDTEFNITLPSHPVSLYHENLPAVSISLNSLRTDLPAGAKIGAEGYLRFHLGGTLEVETTQNTGMYSGSFELIISYQ